MGIKNLGNENDKILNAGKWTDPSMTSVPNLKCRFSINTTCGSNQVGKITITVTKNAAMWQTQSTESSRKKEKYRSESDIDMWCEQQ